jgi:hypothetical protein
MERCVLAEDLDEQAVPGGRLLAVGRNRWSDLPGGIELPSSWRLGIAGGVFDRTRGPLEWPWLEYYDSPASPKHLALRTRLHLFAPMLGCRKHRRPVRSKEADTRLQRHLMDPCQDSGGRNPLRRKLHFIVQLLGSRRRQKHKWFGEHHPALGRPSMVEHMSGHNEVSQETLDSLATGQQASRR